MKEVIVLQHAAPETPGLIAQVLRERGYAIRPVLGFAGQRVPKTLEGAAGLVIMGGPMGVYEHEAFPFLRAEMRLMGSALREGKAVLGVCLGSQLLASALGARVRKGKQKEIGWHLITFDESSQMDPLSGCAGRRLMALHWHGDVFDLPQGAVNLASSKLTACQAFCYGNLAYGFLFHMEMTYPMLRAMTRHFAGELKKERLDGGQILRGARRYLPQLAAAGKRTFEGWVDLMESCREQRVTS